MSDQVFINLDDVTVELSKLTHIKHPSKGGPITLHFDGGNTLKLTCDQAERLMNVVKQLDSERKLTARMAPPIGAKR